MKDYKSDSLELHKKLKGKLEVVPKQSAKNMDDLSLVYSPGVGAVSAHLANNPDQASTYTGTGNSVAIVSDGSSVLGLGDIGPTAALPVMEGKAQLFKQFAGIDGYPVVLDVHEIDQIVAAVKAIAPTYGAINLEDIGAPQCFEIEERLKKELDIPIMHDDQHGTAVVVLAGLINAIKVTNKEFRDIKVVIVGAGAAGIAITKLLAMYEPSMNLLAVDSKGIISSDRADLNTEKQLLLEVTNMQNQQGSLNDAVVDADVFIGVSRAGLLKAGMVKKMAKDPIIFALANPDPEILPDEAKSAGAAVVATGRSDYPNQVNNAVAFPGIFRGALDNNTPSITDQHKIAAAETIAGLIEAPSPDCVIPNVFDKRLVKSIAKVIV